MKVQNFVRCLYLFLIRFIADRVEFLDVQEWDKTCYPTIDAEQDEEEEKIETEFGISKEGSPISRRKIGRKSLLSRSFSERFGSVKLSDQPRSRVSYAYGRGRSLEEVLHSFPGLIKSPRLLRSLKNTPIFGRTPAVLGKETDTIRSKNSNLTFCL